MKAGLTFNGAISLNIEYTYIDTFLLVRVDPIQRFLDRYRTYLVEVGAQPSFSHVPNCRLDKEILSNISRPNRRFAQVDRNEYRSRALERVGDSGSQLSKPFEKTGLPLLGNGPHLKRGVW